MGQRERDATAVPSHVCEQSSIQTQGAYREDNDCTSKEGRNSDRNEISRSAEAQKGARESKASIWYQGEISIQSRTTEKNYSSQG